jgi:hypothetical protein
MSPADFDLHRLEILRYEALPPPYPRSAGYSGLRLVLPHKAVGHELDTIWLSVIDWRGRPQNVRVHPDNAPTDGERVAPGRIHIRSHREEEGAFYTYGGEMTVAHVAQELIVTMTSPAPVLELAAAQDTVANLLAAETEAALGRLEATLKEDHEELIAHLLRPELRTGGPLALYLAIVRSLLAAHETGEQAPFAKLVAQLQLERDWYRRSGDWAAHPHSLRELVEA